MQDSSVKVIFFDAAGTLFHIQGSVADVYLHYAIKYGVSESLEVKKAINSAFLESFQQAPPPVFAVTQPEKLKQCERLWWFDIVHAVFYRVGMFEGFDDYFDEVFEAFGTGLHWQVFPEVYSILGELRSKGFELGIISNFDTRLFRILDDLNLRGFFDTITISSLAKSVKPSKQIFQFAIEEHAVDPDEAIHIGDSFKEDWEGAKQAGLHSVFLNRTNIDTPKGVITIDNLNELLGLMT